MLLDYIRLSRVSLRFRFVRNQDLSPCDFRLTEGQSERGVMAIWHKTELSIYFGHV